MTKEEEGSKQQSKTTLQLKDIKAETDFYRQKRAKRFFSWADKEECWRRVI